MREKPGKLIAIFRAGASSRAKPGTHYRYLLGHPFPAGPAPEGVGRTVNTFTPAPAQYILLWT
jgi:hypothetical protein